MGRTVTFVVAVEGGGGGTFVAVAFGDAIQRSRALRDPGVWCTGVRSGEGTEPPRHLANATSQKVVSAPLEKNKNRKTYSFLRLAFGVIIGLNTSFRLNLTSRRTRMGVG